MLMIHPTVPKKLNKKEGPSEDVSIPHNNHVRQSEGETLVGERREGREKGAGTGVCVCGGGTGEKPRGSQD